MENVNLDLVHLIQQGAEPVFCFERSNLTHV